MVRLYIYDRKSSYKYRFNVSSAAPLQASWGTSPKPECTCPKMPLSPPMLPRSPAQHSRHSHHSSHHSPHLPHSPHSSHHSSHHSTHHTSSLQLRGTEHHHHSHSEHSHHNNHHNHHHRQHQEHQDDHKQQQPQNHCHRHTHELDDELDSDDDDSEYDYDSSDSEPDYLNKDLDSNDPFTDDWHPHDFALHSDSQNVLVSYEFMHLACTDIDELKLHAIRCGVPAKVIKALLHPGSKKIVDTFGRNAIHWCAMCDIQGNSSFVSTNMLTAYRRFGCFAGVDSVWYSSR